MKTTREQRRQLQRDNEKFGDEFVVRLAKDAGFAQDEYGDVAESTWDSVARLVFTVQQAERTRIAELVESYKATPGLAAWSAWPQQIGLVIRAIGCSDDSERSRQITNDVYLSDEKHEWPDPPTAFCPEQAPRSDPPEIDLR